MKRIRQLRQGLSVVIIILTGCSSGNKEITPSAGQPVKVKVREIGSISGTNTQSYIGTVEESRSVPLSFLVSGTAEKVLADEGQFVNKGQLLAVLNSENYQNTYQIAFASEEQAQDAFNRMEPVYKKGSLPEIKYIEVKTGLEQARSATSIARKNLRDCKLYAPASGMIGKKMIEPGMSVVPGNPVFKLVKIEKVKVKIPVPENEITGIGKGLKATVKVSAVGDQQFEGEVEEIGVLSNPLSHTYMVKVVLENKDNLLKPGMVCKVSMSNPVLANRIIIPLSAVQTDEGNNGKYVFLANPNTNKAIKSSVTVGALVSDGVVINDGLSAGDLLITEGYQKISENSIIQIIR